VRFPTQTGEVRIAEDPAVDAGQTQHAVKRPASGLISRNGLPPAGYAFSGYTANLLWADLNPAEGSYDFATLDEARALASGHGLQFRARVMAGIHAPGWLKAALGTVTVIDRWDGRSGAPLRWWLPDAATAYRRFMAATAAHVDGEPDVLEVSATLATTIYSEPFQRQTGSAETRANLLAAGYTVEADRSAIAAMIDAHVAFLTTRTGIAHNPFQWVQGDGSAGRPDVAYTIAMMDRARDTLGARAVLQNNSLDAPDANNANVSAMYDAIRARGGAIAFQTRAPARLTGARQVVALLEYAVSLGAGAVELAPSGWQQWITPAQAAAYDARLKDNAEGVE
jgi:hypothetical protein